MSVPASEKLPDNGLRLAILMVALGTKGVGVSVGIGVSVGALVGVAVGGTIVAEGVGTCSLGVTAAGAQALMASKKMEMVIKTRMHVFIESSFAT